MWRSEIDDVWIYTLAYGGGIVSVSIPIRPELFCIVSVSFSSCCMIVIYVDSIPFDLSIEDGCTVVLTTQASTKVKDVVYQAFFSLVPVAVTAS
ncbi:hypothetical protein L1987_32679 [Smallanthus sonchifolius]|uniref:Uncharacterized protein n=1 Tax=Smallanthus sonchifolius TaxID=185202 RepID=A0ACB9HNN6_9ASTR|nr:hypothetical protein L1987_32679 [Smallanthus sonchifolius]